MGIRDIIVTVPVIVAGLAGVLAVSAMAQTDMHDSSRMTHVNASGSGAACVSTRGRFKLMTVDDGTLLVTDKSGAGALIAVSGCGLQNADHVSFSPKATVCETGDVKVTTRSDGDSNGGVACFVESVRQVSADEASSLAVNAHQTS